MIAYIHPRHDEISDAGKNNWKEKWYSNYYQRLVKKFKLEWIKINQDSQMRDDLPPALTEPLDKNPYKTIKDNISLTHSQNSDIHHPTSNKQMFIPLRQLITQRKFYTTCKIKVIILSLIVFVFQGIISMWFGYAFSNQCTRTPVLPWLVFTHGIISFGTFLIILLIIKNNFRIHGEIRILSSLYAVIVILSVIISIFNDNHGNNTEYLECSNEISILLKVNTPWAIAQICLLQILIL